MTSPTEPPLPGQPLAPPPTAQKTVAPSTCKCPAPVSDKALRTRQTVSNEGRSCRWLPAALEAEHSRTVQGAKAGTLPFLSLGPTQTPCFSLLPLPLLLSPRHSQIVLVTRLVGLDLRTDPAFQPPRMSLENTHFRSAQTPPPVKPETDGLSGEAL